MDPSPKRQETIDADLSNLAAEYALGILQGAERRHFEQLMASNPTLRSFVLRWGGVLRTLEPQAEPLAAEPKDESMWERLERRLDVEEKVMTRLHEHQLTVRNSLAVSIGALRVLRQRLAERRILITDPADAQNAH